MSEFHTAMGQFINYRAALEEAELNYTLEVLQNQTTNNYTDYF